MGRKVIVKSGGYYWCAPSMGGTDKIADAHIYDEDQLPKWFNKDYHELIDAPEAYRRPALPTADAERKKLPVFDGVLCYFPDAILAIAEVSRVGNDQHNPGQPLHWAKEKSTDHFNTGLRHQLDHKTGTRYDTDGTRHLAKAAWRALAALQIDIEQERNGK